MISSYPRKLTTGLVSLLVAVNIHAAVVGNMIGNQSQNEGMLVLPTDGDVVIDGRLDDWDLSGRIWIFSDVSIRDRYSAKVSAMWDRNFLYLAARWRDPTPMTSVVDPDFNPENGWRSDSWQMRFLTDHRCDLTTWYFSEKQMPVMHLSRDSRGQGGEVLRGANGPALGRGIEMAYARTDENEFVQEVRIPWRELYKDIPVIEPGLTFRLGNDFLWGDVTAGKQMPEHRYSDNIQPGVTNREFFWRNPKPWGNAVLVAEGNVLKRRYFSAGLQPKGVIPVRPR